MRNQAVSEWNPSAQSRNKLISLRLYGFLNSSQPKMLCTSDEDTGVDMQCVKHVDSPLLYSAPVSHVWRLGLVHIVISVPAFSFPFFFPDVTLCNHPDPVGDSWQRFVNLEQWQRRGQTVADMLAGHISRPPQSKHLRLLPGTATHTSSLPFCLSPQGTPAFLSACGSHKSDYPSALLTTHPREWVRGWAWLERATKPLFMHPSEAEPMPGRQEGEEKRHVDPGVWLSVRGLFKAKADVKGGGSKDLGKN